MEKFLNEGFFKEVNHWILQSMLLKKTDLPEAIRCLRRAISMYEEVNYDDDGVLELRLASYLAMDGQLWEAKEIIKANKNKNPSGSYDKWFFLHKMIGDWPEAIVGSAMIWIVNTYLHQKKECVRNEKEYQGMDAWRIFSERFSDCEIEAVHLKEYCLEIAQNLPDLSWDEIETHVRLLVMTEPRDTGCS